MKPLWLEPGDVVLTKSTTRLGKLIRFFTRRIGEGKTVVNHAAVVTRPGWDTTSRYAIIVEALEKVKKHSLWSQYGWSKTEVAIFRPTNLLQEERFIIADAAENYVGKKYGALKLLAHFGDWILQGRYVFRRLARMEDYPICSWLVAHAFSKVGKDFGCPVGAASPDDIWDFCHANPDKYTLIHPLGRLT